MTVNMFFKKKDKTADNLSVLEHVHGKTVKYTTIRGGENYAESVIGRYGSVHLKDGYVIINGENGVCFKKKLEDLVCGELLSKEGATFEYDESGVHYTVVAYYTYYR